MLDCARVVELDAQFASMGADIVGMQEGRLPSDGSMESCNYVIYRVGATPSGTDGTLIWVSKALKAKLICTVPVAPRILRVSVAVSKGVIHVISAHAPWEDADAAEKDSFWAELDSVLYSAGQGDLEGIIALCIDANAKVGS